jgi:hypothetical protein
MEQAWWDEHYKLNKDLWQLLRNIDERYFQSFCLNDFITPCDDNADDSCCVGNLSARCEVIRNLDTNRRGTREDCGILRNAVQEKESM